jgi:hypothetical protein
VGPAGRCSGRKASTGGDETADRPTRACRLSRPPTPRTPPPSLQVVVLDKLDYCASLKNLDSVKGKPNFKVCEEGEGERGGGERPVSLKIGAATVAPRLRGCLAPRPRSPCQPLPGRPHSAYGGIAGACGLEVGRGRQERERVAESAPLSGPATARALSP